MRRLAILALAAASLAGCESGVEAACSDFCSDIAACFGASISGDQLNECETECADGFAELPSECEDVAVDVLECSAEALCSNDSQNIAERCANVDVPVACEAAFDDGGNCCADGDPCDWAEDGFCDCSGQFAWDSVDCGGT
ncbi:MAG: hypothetical protein AAFY60_19280 [Myxococcota bacterium]